MQKNAHVDEVKSFMHAWTFACDVCLSMSLSVSVRICLSVFLYVANANLRPARIDLFRNIKLRMRIFIALELCCNCDCDFLLSRNQLWNIFCEGNLIRIFLSQRGDLCTITDFVVLSWTRHGREISFSPHNSQHIDANTDFPSNFCCVLDKS